MSLSEEAREMGIEGGAAIEVNEDEGVTRILRLCDPRRSLQSDSDFLTFWTEVRDVVGAFVERHPPLHPKPTTFVEGI
jgi:hypothetical protein